MGTADYVSSGIVSCDCSRWLDKGKLLTGTPTVFGDDSLTITNKSINVDSIEINNRGVPAGKAVQFKVTPTEVGEFTIVVACTTTASPAESKVGQITLKVVP